MISCILARTCRSDQKADVDMPVTRQPAGMDPNHCHGRECCTFLRNRNSLSVPPGTSRVHWGSQNVADSILGLNDDWLHLFAARPLLGF